MTCEAEIPSIIKSGSLPWSINLVASNRDATTGAITTPVNITGKNITASFTYGLSGAVISITIGDGITITSGVGGNYNLTLSSARMALLTVGDEVILSKPSGTLT